MKKKRVWMALCLQVCLLAACTRETTDPVADRHDDWLEVVFTTAETRTDLDENGAGTFSEGDKVGLFIDNGSSVEYRELTCTNGKWLPLLKRSDFGPGELTLSAHYPAHPEAKEDPAHAVVALSADQSSGGFAASDLLFARKKIPAGDRHAEMTFAHALHRLRIRLEGEGLSTPSLRSRMSGKVDLLTGEVSAPENSFGWITPRQNNDGAYEAVIFPQETAPYRDEEGLLKIPTTARDVVYKVPELLDGKPFSRFEAGKQLTIRLNLTGSADLKWANRKVWVYGIKAPEEGAWKQTFLNAGYDFYCLPWKAEYGWYDCNKVTPEGGEPDGMMCWAASASNLLHWWIAQNKSYIDRYGDRYKGPDYSYPLKKPQESDIFKCFADTFDNVAGYGDAGVNWFIHGASKDLSLPKWDIYNEGGYFKDVFPEGVRLSVDIGGLGKEKFNETIKDALANKKAIGIAQGTVQKGHVETVWGAEFDENGDVSAIYMADNNDRDAFEAYGLGCMRFEIVYERYPEGATYTAYKSGYIDNNKSIALTRVFVLSLGQEYWEEYFKNEAANSGTR